MNLAHDKSPPSSPMLVLGMAAWLALFSAAADLAALLVKKYGLGEFVHHAGSHLLWMIPLSNLIFFAVPVLLVALAHRRWPSVVRLRFAIAVPAIMAWFGIFILAHRHLHDVAIWALVLGASWQTALFIERRPGVASRLVRYTLPAMLAAVVLAAGIVLLGPRTREPRSIARLPDPVPNAPSVILVILDTVREISLSLDGGLRPTSPNLEALGRQSVVFTQAFAPSNWTPPSHASVFTGRWSHEFPRIGAKPMAGTFPTLAEVFSSRGYLTAGFSGNRIVNRESGLTRGFVHYEAFANSLGQLLNAGMLGKTIQRFEPVRRLLGLRDVPGRQYADDINANVLDWIDGADDRPFFIFINYFDAHAPYVPPEPWDTLFDPNGRGRRPALVEQLSLDQLTPEVIRAEQNAYEGAIAFADHELGSLIQQLAARGRLENTILVISSDHGEEFGEHGATGHGHTLYTELLHVPLLLRAPGRAPAGLRVDTPVTIADIPATITHLVGFSDSPLAGGSLSALWGDRARRPPRLPFSAWDDNVALVVGGHHYIRNADKSEEIFDLRGDPAQKYNLVSAPAASEALVQARRIVEQIASGADVEGLPGLPVARR